MDLTVLQYGRTLFTFFDLLSEIGGLSGILVSFCAIIVMIWNGNKFDNFMAYRLFKLKRIKPRKAVSLYHE